MNHPSADPFDHFWLDTAIRLQALAQAGLFYAKDRFDQERYEEIRSISANMMEHLCDTPIEQIKDLFCNETGYQTPKLDTRAAIVDGDKILLVRERDGLWSMPGGWVEVDGSIRENVIKESLEEAGMQVTPLRIAAIEDRKKHNLPVYPYGVTKVFVLCQKGPGEFAENCETTERRWFTLDDLPPLAEAKNNREQIELCFAATKDPYWNVFFD